MAAVIDGATERFMLRSVHNEVFGRLDLVNLGPGDQANPYVPIYQPANCENLGSRQITKARQEHESVDVFIARYNMVRLWTQDLCHGHSDVLPSSEEAKTWLVELATRVKIGKSPFLDTHEMLAEFYLFGAPGFAPDYTAGLAYLNQEKKQEEKMHFGRIALTLSYVYEHGLGVPLDPAKAREWVQRAFDAGNRDAEILMAQAREVGFGVERDEAGAFAAYQKLSGDNTASIWFRLGLMYLDGRGTSKDPCKAQEFFTKASQSDRGPMANAKKHLVQIRQQNLCPAAPSGEHH